MLYRAPADEDFPRESRRLKCEWCGKILPTIHVWKCFSGRHFLLVWWVWHDKAEPVVLDNGISIPTSRTEFGDVVGLSPQADGVYYIVSQLVKSTLPDRTDLLVPAELVRDERGNIVGCGSLGR